MNKKKQKNFWTIRHGRIKSQTQYKSLVGSFSSEKELLAQKREAHSRFFDLNHVQNDSIYLNI